MSDIIEIYLGITILRINNLYSFLDLHLSVVFKDFKGE